MAEPLATPADPRNALYFATIAQLEHQRDNAYNSATEQQNFARANTKYGQNQLTQREPGTYKANAARANRGGILESGVNAERKGTIASDYANRRYQLTHGLQETEGRIQKGVAAAKENFADQSARALAGAEKESREWLLNNPPNELGPANAGGIKNITGPPEAGGVVPYRETSKGGSVAVGSATRYAREMAAKRALDEKRK